jgi:hypothetical protein
MKWSYRKRWATVVLGGPRSLQGLDSPSIMRTSNEVQRFTGSWNLSCKDVGERFIYDHAWVLKELQGWDRETTFTHEPGESMRGRDVTSSVVSVTTSRL